MLCLFIVKLSMSYLLWKEMYYLVPNNLHPTHSLARIFLNFVIVSGKTSFLNVLMCYVLSVHEKEWIFGSSRLPFWITISQKFDNLSLEFRCSYDIESTVYYSFPGQWKLSQIHPPYTHDYRNTLLLDTKDF